MKKIKIFILLAGIITLSQSCTKDELQSSSTKDFIFLDSSNIELFFERLGTGVTTNAGLRVIKHSNDDNTAVNYQFEILESSTAIEGTHYSVGNYSGVFESNSFIDTLPIEIISANLIPCELKTLDIRLIGSDFEKFSTGILTVSLNLESASELAGTVNYVHSENFTDEVLTGTVEIIARQTPGEYSISDFSFGAWPAAYNIDPPTGTLKWSNNCSKITLSGTDNYGDVWKMDEIIESGGPEFIFTWSNTYGEFGKVSLTRVDGSPWPTLNL